MCNTAFAKGLCAVGFSAHAPVFKYTGLKTDWHMPDEKLNEYMDEVLAARRRWQGKLAIYLGLELDYIKGMRSALDSDIKALNLDYIIGSVHYLVPKNSEPFTFDGSIKEFEKGFREGYNGDKEALMGAYWEAIEEMISLGGIDILGHMDIFKINCKNIDTENEAAQVTKIAQAAARAEIAVEVNTGGINRGRASDTFPSARLLRIFCEQKVPAIITADAHDAAELGGNYDIALKNLAEAGYTDHILFEGKENQKNIWHSQKINYNN